MNKVKMTLKLKMWVLNQVFRMKMMHLIIHMLLMWKRMPKCIETTMMNLMVHSKMLIWISKTIPYPQFELHQSIPSGRGVQVH